MRWPHAWIAAAKPARSAGRSRALTSTTVVRVEARSAIATDGATSNAVVRRPGSAPGTRGRAGAARRAGRRGAGPRRSDGARKPGAQPPIRIGLATPVEHQQIVERHAVAGG